MKGIDRYLKAPSQPLYEIRPLENNEYKALVLLQFWDYLVNIFDN